MLKFRKESLTDYELLERKTHIPIITPPFGQLGFIILYTLIFIFCAWLIWGSISWRQTGYGILINNGGNIRNVVAEENGLVTKILVGIGNQVQKGQVLIELQRSDLELQQNLAKEYIEHLAKENKWLQDNYQKEQSLMEAHYKEQKKSISEVLELQKKQRIGLEKALPERMKLVEKGIYSKIEMEAQNRIYYRLVESINNNTTQLIKIESDYTQFVDQWHQRLLDIEQKILAKQIELKQLTKKIEMATQIKAPVNGIVTSIKASTGKYITASTAVVGISNESDRLGALLFFPASQGILIKPGMKTLIEPSGIRSDRYGSLLAKVISVQSFPASKSDILSIVDNEEFADKLLQIDRSLVMAQVTLDKRDSTNYRWTSKLGYPGSLFAGNLCEGRIITRSERPIDLIIPGLKYMTGLID